MRLDVLFISSSGGHFVQIQRLAKQLALENSCIITETVGGSGDLRNNKSSDCRMLYLPRGGREEGFKYLFLLMQNFALSFWRVLKYRPRVVITTGAHTAVPTCLIAKLIGSRIIYIETFARTDGLTLTGRLLYVLADRFYVQWPRLAESYKKAVYKGALY